MMKRKSLIFGLLLGILLFSCSEVTKYTDSEDISFENEQVSKTIYTPMSTIVLSDGPSGWSGRLGMGNYYAETIIGTNRNDYILGGGGGDTINGGSGNDIIYGDLGYAHECTDGADNIDGGPGNDIIYGGAGNDVIKGGEGNDRIYTGGAGNIKKIYTGGGWAENTIFVSQHNKRVDIYLQARYTYAQRVILMGNKIHDTCEVYIHGSVFNSGTTCSISYNSPDGPSPIIVHKQGSREYYFINDSNRKANTVDFIVINDKNGSGISTAFTSTSFAYYCWESFYYGPKIRFNPYRTTYF